MEASYLDKLNLAQQPNIISQLQPKEQIELSILIKKINEQKIAQERIFLLTNQAIYNITRRSSFIKSLVSKIISLQSRFCIKRKIALNRLYGITLSKLRENYQFILHVIDDYDYTYCAESHERKVLLLRKICQVYSQFNGGKKLPFYFKDQIVLSHYVTRKQDVKTRTDKKPKQNAVFLGEQDFQYHQLPDLDYKLQYSLKGNNSVTMNMFTPIFQIEKLCNQHRYYTITPSNIDLKRISSILNLESPYLLKPQFVFSNKTKLQLLTPFMIGGNLSCKLKQSVRISEDLAYFYIAQLILILQSLLQNSISYGNFALQNIFISQNGYLKLLAVQKDIQIKEEFIQPQTKFSPLSFNIIGFAQYIPPQMILLKGHHLKEVYLWKLGVCAYNLLLGSYPFTGINTKRIYHQILSKKLQSSTPDFVLKLLDRNPQKRIAFQKLKHHPKLAHIDWKQLKEQAIPAPFLPDTSSWKGNLPSIVQLKKIAIQGTKITGM